MTNLDKIKHIVCISSGKGGVGKSTTAVNLSLALSHQGQKVGLLDADIYGPSIPLMMGVAPGTRPEIRDQKFIKPIVAHGIECNSMGFLVDPRTAMVWRAPMIVSAFNQILNDSDWSDLDFLIIDMPPGTGDIQLSLAQSTRVTGAIVVTTPQDVALLDARKGIEMFNKVGVPILGVVENMSTHVCANCGHEEAIFGSGGGDQLAADYGVAVLARLPLELKIRQQTDSGHPVVASDVEGSAAQSYIALANTLIDRMGQQTGSRTDGPSISVSDD